MRVRNQASVVTRFLADEVPTFPDQFAGKLLEIRGQIDAIVGDTGQSTLLISETEQGVPLLVKLPPGKHPADWPFLDVGIRIRALCQVVKSGGSTFGSLELVIPVKETGAPQKEVEAPPADEDRLPPAPLFPPPRPADSPASDTGRLSPEELVAIYGNALRYFHGGLGEADAEFLARRILDESRRYGLDARLLVAVVVMEGTLKRVRSVDRGIYIGKQTARSALAEMGKDLSRRISRTGPRKGPTESSIAKALAARRRDQAGKTRGSRAEIERYVTRVLRCYRQICGLE